MYARVCRYTEIHPTKSILFFCVGFMTDNSTFNNDYRAASPRKANTHTFIM